MFYQDCLPWNSTVPSRPSRNLPLVGPPSKLQANNRFFELYRCRKQPLEHSQTKHQQTSYPSPILHDLPLGYIFSLCNKQRNNTTRPARAPSSGRWCVFHYYYFYSRRHLQLPGIYGDKKGFLFVAFRCHLLERRKKGAE